MIINYKTAEKIPFTDQFMFSLVMRNKDICLGILQLIMPDENFTEVRSVDVLKEIDFSVSTEATLKFAADAHGVRFDAFAKSNNAWAGVEMQTYSGTNIAKRSRYYQANMDIEALNSGKSYDELPKSYVIFICTYDYFGVGEPVYYFRNYDAKNNLHFNDDSFKIILNTKCSPEKIPEKLKPLFDYIENRRDADRSELIERIDSEVTKYSGSEWRWRFMTLEDIKRSERKEGWNEGLKEGRIEAFYELFSKGIITLEQAAENSGLSQEDFLSKTKGIS